MNDSPSNSNDSDRLAEQLTLATATQLPAGREIDGETVELRQAWLAWGQMLEASEGSFDEAGLVAALAKTAQDNSAVNAVSPSPATSPVAPAARGTLLAWVAALAITALLAIGAYFAWSANTSAPSTVVLPQSPATPIVPVPAPAPMVVAVPDQIEGGNVEDETYDTAILAWDDSELESAIDQVATGLEAAARPRESMLSESDWLYQRLDEFQQELNDGAL